MKGNSLNIFLFIIIIIKSDLYLPDNFYILLKD